MTTSSRAGLALVKQFEGCKLTAYPDPGSGGEPWTIGYGHTGGVRPGQKITQAQADTWLLADYDEHEAKVRALVKVSLTENQLGALCSFTYNVGPNNLRTSTLLKLLNKGDYKGAADQLLVWNKASGHVLAGLVTRRAAERDLFVKP